MIINIVNDVDVNIRMEGPSVEEAIRSCTVAIVN